MCEMGVPQYIIISGSNSCSSVSACEVVLHILKAYTGRQGTHPGAYRYIQGDLRANPAAILGCPG